ncbi:hypothetical protein [Salibaculum sp.]|uniref:hypothetical protein n=1 Tax=Salibaculum sp. TaxID=2855480 RepID=UPI002B47F53F|nr:hypothetical protein [Salibaculum sp.]HKL70050.1 hypothetical protein [Salibaculum sp.]
MTASGGTGPVLHEGEEVIFDHVPSLRSFQLTALVLLGLTLLPAAGFAAVFPDSFWPAVPFFLTCMILLQERFRLGRHRAWITSRRIVLQEGEEIAMKDVDRAVPRGNGVRVTCRRGARRRLRLSYAPDRPALARAINTVAQEAS